VAPVSRSGNPRSACTRWCRDREERSMRKPGGHCAHVPEFERLNYFYGQVLGHHELAKEQAFFREKMRLHNRCLHGWGILCGLGVTPVPPPEPCPPDPCKPEPEPAVVEIE